jgi:hypothetical protein
MSMLTRFVRQGWIAAIGVAALAASPALAQMETIDPNAGIDADLAQPAQRAAENPGEPAPYDSAANAPAPAADVASDWADPVVTSADPSAAASQAASEPAVAAAQGDTYKKDDLIGAAEGVFGKGAEGVARMIEDLLKKQGEPNAYIVGREAGGAFVVGARYGSGTLYHKVEGQRPVYWTGPSIGFDAGANAGNTFVLVYNLYDSEELFERYPAGEGAAYVIGGLNASYMRKGDVVLIPIRVGAGLRLGVNAGYMKFSKKQRWLPF